jgi:hypothetical protein
MKTITKTIGFFFLALFIMGATTEVYAGGNGPAKEGASEEITMDMNMGANQVSDQLRITLELPQQADFKLQIYDLQGQLAATLHNGSSDAGTQNYRMRTNGFESGTYLVRLTSTTGQIISEKVTLN